MRMSTRNSGRTDPEGVARLRDAGVAERGLAFHRATPSHCGPLCEASPLGDHSGVAKDHRPEAGLLHLIGAEMVEALAGEGDGLAGFVEDTHAGFAGEFADHG